MLGLSKLTELSNINVRTNLKTNVNEGYLRTIGVHYPFDYWSLVDHSQVNPSLDNRSLVNPSLDNRSLDDPHENKRKWVPKPVHEDLGP